MVKNLLGRQVYLSIPEGKTKGIIQEVRSGGQVKIQISKETFIVTTLKSNMVEGIQIELGDFFNGR